jgi:hypothetical protein
MASLVSTIIASALRNAVQALHPRENLFATGTLGALNAEVQVFCDGCSTVALDLRGTFSHTVAVQGTVDGVNWQLIPVRPVTGGVFVLGIVGTVSGTWMASCSGFTKVRALVTAYTSGGSTATLSASNALFDDAAKNGGVAPLTATATGAAAAAVTLTIAAPGVGLRHYITGIEITRTATAALAGTATLVITTTNIPGALAWSVGNAMNAGGTQIDVDRDFSYPVMTTAQNTATTIVAPAPGAAVLWRITAYYYVAP